jgi:regulatory protein
VQLVNEETGDGVQTSDVLEEVERRAIDAALNFLSYRQRTGQEVERKLASRGFSEQTIGLAMRRLGAVGLVDDEAFVGAFARDRIAHRPMGMRRMVRELYMKGIAREVSEPVILEVFQDENTDERELAMRVIEKKRRTLASRSGDVRVLRRRLRDHLIRRGFDGRIVTDVVNELYSESDTAGDE